jgi:hypothetical protein
MCFGSIKDMTVPFRYQIPSPVCHTSSASIITPLSSWIFTGPLLFFDTTLVEMGFELNTKGVVVGTGEADGEALGDGEGSSDGLGLGTRVAGIGVDRTCGCTTLELTVG